AQIAMPLRLANNQVCPWPIPQSAPAFKAVSSWNRMEIPARFPFQTGCTPGKGNLAGISIRIPFPDRVHARVAQLRKHFLLRPQIPTETAHRDDGNNK